MVLYPYQERVKKLVQNGHSVIIQAPTGSGKTRAALAPFIEEFFDRPGSLFPHKCIYAVPMRVLANQFFSEYDYLSEKYRRKYRHNIDVRIQTGEQPRDRKFEADLTFATIDQVLSSFLHMPYSLPRKLANFNAGAIVASYLIFDEFHLFDPITTLPTTLEMLRIVRDVSPFVLMTATFSSTMLQGLADWLDAIVIPGNDDERKEMLSLPVEQNKQRYYQWHSEALTADAVFAAHQHRSLVVCNTVARAQSLFRDLRDHQQRGDTKVILLHSRFLPEHRRRKEQLVQEYFGKETDRTRGSVIIVATQVVEVGLDISAEVLHTELAPANAILQRAGRCARFQDELGYVHIYPTESVLPYSGLAEVIQLTAEWLAKHSGDKIGFEKEQALVDFAHGKFDRLLFEGVKATNSQHRYRMEAALNGDRETAGELIRKIASQPLTISANPELLSERPFSVPIFSLHPGSLRGAAKKWLDDEECLLELNERLWRLEELPDDTEVYRTRYAWNPIWNEQLLRGAPLVAVHPDLASYDPDEGLVLDRGGDFRAEDLGPTNTNNKDNDEGWIPFYRLESYDEHVRLVYEAFINEAWPEISRAAKRIEQRSKWQPGSIRKAAEMVVLLHDVGKLSQAWQTWVDEWQSSIGRPIPAGFFAAHTDFDGFSTLHHDLEKKMRRRPPHAVEGAVAVSPILASALRKEVSLLKASFSAIARHHGAFSRTFQPYRLHKHASMAVKETYQRHSTQIHPAGPISLRTQDDPSRSQITSLLIDADDNDELLAYMVLSRALRRADQSGTAKGSE